MVENYQDFYEKESYRADRRERARREEREHRERTQRESQRTKQDFQNDREEAKFDRQEERDFRNNALKKKLNDDKIKHQNEMLSKKEDLALATAEARATGTVEAEQIRARKEYQLKRMEIEGKLGILRAEVQLYEERIYIDFDDEVRRTRLREQEYALMRSLDLLNEKALRRVEHNNKMDFMREDIKSLMVDKVLAHKLEKSRMTHETDEKIRLAYALGDQKRYSENLEKADQEAIIEQNKAQWKADLGGGIAPDEADIIEERKPILDEEIETEQRKGQYLKFKMKN